MLAFHLNNKIRIIKILFLDKLVELNTVRMQIEEDHLINKLML